MLPSWATIVLAILGSAMGGLLGAFLQIRHERRETFRDRMLESADQAAASVAEALSATRGALRDVEDYMAGFDTSKERTKTLFARASDAADRGAERVGRVELLFGLDSGLGETLNLARRALRRAIEEAGPSPPEFDRAWAAWVEADQAYRRFISEARTAAEEYGRWSYVHRRRRRRQPEPDTPAEDSASPGSS
jgi:ABC-type transporter Mla subunit MlaD